MHILITGAGGMIGQRLATRLAAKGLPDGRRVTSLTLSDVTEPPVPGGIEARAVGADLTLAGTAERLCTPAPDMVIHLAAVVSGQAEADFTLGWRVNVDATRTLLEAAAASGKAPRFVFTSSLAVFGAPLPDVIQDDQQTAPRSSYGAQKAVGELMVSDWSRKGFIDGLALRLPTIIVRPGSPNAAASSFYSSILREPLAGQRARLPVPRETRHWFASPQAAAGYLAHACVAETAYLGARRALNLPGVSATVADLIAALERAAPGASALIDEVPDPTIADIVTPWPRAFAPERALALGFAGDPSVDAIVAQHQAGMAQL